MAAGAAAATAAAEPRPAPGAPGGREGEALRRGRAPSAP